MARRSFASHIDLNGESVDMSVSEFLTYLSTIDDVSEKVNNAHEFILNLKEEMLMIAASPYQFPNCMRFLKDAIAAVHEKWKCAKKKEGTQHDSNPNANAVGKATAIINNENKNVNEGQTDTDESFLENEVPSEMNSDPIRSDASIQDGELVMHEPMVQPEYIRSDRNVVHELIRRQRMVWSVDLHRRFKFAVEALGGPREAKPKQIHDLLKVDGLTTEQIKSHLQRYRKHLISRGQHRSFPGSNQYMQNRNAMLVRTRFSLLCESSNSKIKRAPTNQTN
ncbi:hypothetical protein L2E82_19003 [Cichorium intybus]|uniref:Uncharacterized protein n=1 Tax=Cichorium intybus TaxID=13427 RepID=A0ACB9FB58_CICIN|nr:hypothetical protein L2E82_19003 [Cichorium intybus]